MTSVELDHLIKMLNQIAENIAAGNSAEATAAQLVADYVIRFWARPMKEQIVAYAAADGEKLNAVAQRAVLHL